MTYEEAREDLKGKLPDYVNSVTKKSKGHNMYICPLCNSGTGSNHSGAFSITADGKSWKCFSCNEHGDIFDLIGKVERIATPLEQLKRACSIYGVNLEYQKQDKSEQNTYTHNSIHTEDKGQETKEETDFTDFFLQANKDLGKTDYYRGITKETLDRYKVGYAESWKHPNCPKAPASPRLIIPITKYSYLARDTRQNLTEEQARYKKQKAKGTEKAVWIFNYRALETAEKPIFIVEGEIDALSIIDVGGEAVALGSIAYINQLLSILDRKKPTQPLVICLDNEKTDSVTKAKKELEDGLTKRNIPYYEADITGECKDANEALLKNREAFKEAIRTAENQREAEEQAERDAYLQTSTASYLQAFIDGIADSVNTPYTPTHFTKLDGILDGGLYEGLYILGAGTSQGKTSFIMQIADAVAKAGTDVLIFSLEMARTELMSRSVSRHTLEEVIAKGGQVSNAKTARGITAGKKYESYSNEELKLINKAIVAYGSYAEHIYIQEGVGDIGIADIREAIQKHIHLTGNTPVVVLDYLQILAPADIRATDKQNTDKAVIELKRITRDFKLTAIALSSFNRSNYNSDVAEGAFKESGAIEYSADVLLGLQFKKVKDKDFNKEQEEQKQPRDMEIKIIKNRNGRKGDSIAYEYYPMFNYFKEV